MTNIIKGKSIKIPAEVYNKLLKFVYAKKMDGIKISMSGETAKAILNYLKRQK